MSDNVSMSDDGIHVRQVLCIKYHTVDQCVALLLLSTNEIKVDNVIRINMTTIQTMGDNTPFGESRRS